MGLDMTSSAFIQRRYQLLSGVFQDVLAAFGAQDSEYETFQGYRVCAVDGSSVNIARDPNAKTFVQHSGAPKGYNQVKVHAVYDVLSKMYLSAEIPVVNNLKIYLNTDTFILSARRSRW